MSEVLKKRKYLQAFKSAYCSDFPFLKHSKKSANHAYCTECATDFSVAHAGRGDIANHAESKKHRDNVAKNRENKKIGNFFSKNDDFKIIRAECLFTAFLVEHNIPLAAADHIGPLLRTIFPNDEIARKYGCGRTKTSNIIDVFAKDDRSKIVHSLKNQPFCIGTDGSNNSDAKLYPIVVTFFNSEKQQIDNNLLGIPVLEKNSTGVNIGNLLIENMKKFDIPIDNCLGLVADNAPVMMGMKSGVVSVLLQHHKNLVVIGCLCHLLNLAAEKAAASLPINVDELLVDIFYYLDKSSKRKESLKIFQELHNTETKKILKHVCTRWLSLGKCLNRLLFQWEPLVSFFKEEISARNVCTSLDTYSIPKKKAEYVKSKHINVDAGKKKASCISTNRRNLTSTCENLAKFCHKQNLSDCKKSVLSREERIFYILSDSTSRCYCLFLCYVIPYFDRLNTTLQSKSPLIHKLRIILLEFLEQILSKFVKACVLKEENCLKVNYHNIQNLKSNDDILVGNEANLLVKTFHPEEREKFYDHVKIYYTKACDYMVHKFPFNDDVLKHAQICNYNLISCASFSSIKYFIDRFPVLLTSVGCSIDDLQSEFCSLQMAKLPDDIVNEKQIDVQWMMIKKFKNVLNENPFGNVSQFMLFLLTIPHSNAECERLFSQVKKNRTEFRASMSNDSLENLLIVKANLTGNCYDTKFTDTFLQKAKSATYIKNNK